MLMPSFHSFFINNLLAPRTTNINEPGIIIREFRTTFRRIGVKVRYIYALEDIYVELQRCAVRKLGQKRAEEVFYRLGKDTGNRYIKLYGLKKVPEPMIPIVIKPMFEFLKMTGFSVSDEVGFDPKTRSLTLRGKDNLICRKTGIGSMFAGCVSAIFSFLYGTQMEAMKTRCCFRDGSCEIICNPEIPPIYPGKDMPELNDYSQLNFERLSKSSESLPTFDQLLKYGKIKVSDSGKHSLHGRTIFAAETGFIDLVTNELDKMGLQKEVGEAVSSPARSLARDMLKGRMQGEKTREFRNIMSVLGYGIPYVKQDLGRLTVIVTNSPVTIYKPIYVSNFIKSFIDETHSKEHRIVDIKRQDSTYRFIYS